MTGSHNLVPVGFDLSVLKEIAGSSPDILENLIAVLEYGLPEQLLEFFFGELVPASAADGSDQFIYTLRITDVDLERLFLACGTHGLNDSHLAPS